MNTPVKFEIAKLLKEKRFDKACNYYYELEYAHLYPDNNIHIWDRELEIKFKNSYQKGKVAAPTISEVVMWLYEKYDIWISLIPDSSSGHKLLDRKFSVSIFRFNINLNVQAEILRKDKNILYFNLPENALEYTIEYILNTYKPTS